MGGSPVSRNARNRRNRGVGGPRDEDGDWRGIRPVTTTRAGRRNSAAPLPAFSFTRFFFFLHCASEHVLAYIRSETRPRPRHREWTPTAAKCIDVRTPSLRSTLATLLPRSRFCPLLPRIFICHYFELSNVFLNQRFL